jgi:hypothetical protein
MCAGGFPPYMALTATGSVPYSSKNIVGKAMQYLRATMALSMPLRRKRSREGRKKSGHFDFGLDIDAPLPWRESTSRKSHLVSVLTAPNRDLKAIRSASS